ncbi:hypothetical protein BC937DRAFT_91179 [Endogone sp. FLAS-F59071]|nr:hypothetical protein BC937DRAFT_91179 [Endogone sp. FLAS-F59071]|eukprot:RUS16458.1 hypothetical protein BC937DRAFT_91179 [Endogone sp. FLAS-F59071]
MFKHISSHPAPKSDEHDHELEEREGDQEDTVVQIVLCVNQRPYSQVHESQLKKVIDMNFDVSWRRGEDQDAASLESWTAAWVFRSDCTMPGVMTDPRMGWECDV